MAREEREIRLRLRTSSEGEEVIDETGRKIGRLEQNVEEFGDRAERGFGKFQASVITINQGLELLRTTMGAIRSLGSDFLGGPLQRADELTKLSRSVGLTVTELSALRVGAELSGVEVNELGQAAGFLSRRMLETAGGVGRAGSIFQALKIDVKDAETGALRPVLDVLGDVADVFERLPDGAEKTALSMELFSRGGAGLVNFLNAGSRGLREFEAEAKSLGVVLDEDFALAAERTNDNLARLSFLAEGGRIAIARALTPAVEEITDRTVDWAKENKDLIQTDLPSFLRDVTVAALGAKRAVGQLTGPLGDAASSIARSLGIPSPSEFFRLAAFFAESAEGPLESRPDPGEERRQQARAQAIADAEEISAEVEALRARLAEVFSKGADETAKAASNTREIVDGQQRVGKAARNTTIELERQTHELDRQRVVVFDIGEAYQQGISRAIEGIFASGADFDIEKILVDAARSGAVEYASAWAESLLSGKDLVTTAWGEVLDDMQQQTTDSVGGLIGSFSSGLKRIGSFFGIGGGASQASNQAAVQFAGSQGSQPIFDALGNVTGFQTAAEGGGVTAAGATGTTAAGGGAGGGLGNLGAIGGIVGLALIAVDTIKNASEAASKEAKRFGATDASVRSEAFLQLPLLNILGQLADKVGVLDNALENPIIANFLFPGSGFLGAPGPVTQIKAVLRDAVQEAGIPEQQVFQAGGHRGVRAEEISRPITEQDVERFRRLGFRDSDIAQSVERNAIQDFERRNIFSTGPGSSGRLLDLVKNRNPEVDALRFGPVLGVVSAALGGDANDKQLLAAVNAFTNNLLLLGYTEDEARRQTLKFADSLGINLVSGLDAVQTKYAETRNKTEEDTNRLIAEMTGLIDLLSEDIPAGVDLAAIAFDNFTEGVGIAVGKFQENAERAIEIFGGLEQAVNQGLKGAIGAAGQTPGTFGSNLYRSILGGIGMAVVEQAFDTVKELPEYQAILDAAAGISKAPDATATGTDFVQGLVRTIGLDDLNGLIRDFSSAALPLLSGQLEVLKTIDEQLAVLPTALREEASNIPDTVRDIRLAELDPRRRGQALRRELSGIDAQLASGLLTPEQQHELLQRQQEIGLALVGIAQQTYAPGSRARRQGVEQGIGILEDTAADLNELADMQEKALQGNTVVTVENTAAMQATTKAVQELSTEVRSLRERSDRLIAHQGHRAGIPPRQSELAAGVEYYMTSERGQRFMRRNNIL